MGSCFYVDMLTIMWFVVYTAKACPGRGPIVSCAAAPASPLLELLPKSRVDFGELLNYIVTLSFICSTKVRNSISDSGPFWCTSNSFQKHARQVDATF